jgi:hypothetical protein
MALYKKGQSGNPSGRPTGRKNQYTKDIKTAYLEAFEKLGGIKGLVKWAQDNPGQFYSHMAKMLPKDVEIKSDSELTINIISNIPEPKPLPPEYAKNYNAGGRPLADCVKVTQI